MPTNCGACGYAGCFNVAEAIASGEVPVDFCPVAGEKTSLMIAEIMGAKADSEKTKKVARVFCRGGNKEAKNVAEYQGVMDCKAANAISGGHKGCAFGCLGFGSCAAACPFGCIIMNENGLPVIDEDTCTACGLCVKACPRNLIELVDKSKTIHVGCTSKDKGRDVRRVCSIGCIACRACVRVCEFDAIKVIDNIAIIDYEKCTNCGKCAEVCPTKTIQSILLKEEAVRA
ncbi:MAG TPA: RnfABCDGE type electron transport complex subunit B [Thermoanaerobacterales bacterium]|nr:RnfABCDGE type electron transport complex subunit B [Thermoanaerobacterales bacterium]